MIKRNLTLFKIDNFFSYLYPITVIMVVYLESITNSYAIAMLILSFTSITVSIMEIPAGIFSDKIGRRKTLILHSIAFFVTAVLMALAGSFNSTSFLFIGAVIFGISKALLSGTDEALIYETAEEMGNKKDFDIIFAKSGFWIQMGLLGAAVIGAVITYYFDMVVLAWVAVVAISPCVIVKFFYIEPKRTKKYKKKKKNSIIHLKIAARKLWRNKRLRFFALINIFDNSISLSANRFESAYFASLVPLWMVNVARMLKQISGAVGFYLLPKIKFLGSVKILFFSIISNIFIRIWGLFLNNIYTSFIISLGNICYGPGHTASSDILHNEFTPSQRATMKSIISFAGNIINAFAMFGLGVLADIYSPKIALIIGVSAKIIVVILSLCILKNSKSLR